MPEVVGVCFKKIGKMYYFSPNGFRVKRGDAVIVETQRGIELGFCRAGNRNVDESKIVPPLKPIVRMATKEDLGVYEGNLEREKSAFSIASDKIREHQLDMKLVSVDYTFDGAKIVFYFSADGRVDFRELVRDLAFLFHTRIELRQIGVRDEAQILGGLGICGRTLCCSTMMGEFMPVSIKMAKEQNLSLNPSKISGACGRLMCCLKYEQEAYIDLHKRTPPVDSLVKTPDGEGIVTECDLMRERVKVMFGNDSNCCKSYCSCDVRRVKNKRHDDKPESAVEAGDAQ